MNKTECATQILCAILGNKALHGSLWNKFYEAQLLASPAARNAANVSRGFERGCKPDILKTSTAEYVAWHTEQPARFELCYPEESAVMRATRAAVEQAIVDHAVELAEKLLKRTT